MTDLDKIIDRVMKLRSSLTLDTDTLTVADRRLLRAHIEHCTLDLQRLLSQLIAPSDTALDGVSRPEAQVNIS